MLRPLECIKNKVTVRAACVCPGAVHTLLLLPKSMNSDRQRRRRRRSTRQRQRQRHRQRRLTRADRGSVERGNRARRQLSVPGQDMKRVGKFATIRMLHATCAALAAAAPAATLKAIKKFKVAFKNAFHKFTVTPRLLSPLPARQPACTCKTLIQVSARRQAASTSTATATPTVTTTATRFRHFVAGNLLRLLAERCQLLSVFENFRCQRGQTASLSPPPSLSTRATCRVPPEAGILCPADIQITVRVHTVRVCECVCVCAWPTDRQFSVNNENGAKNTTRKTIEMDKLKETAIMKTEKRMMKETLKMIEKTTKKMIRKVLLKKLMLQIIINCC